MAWARALVYSPQRFVTKGPIFSWPKPELGTKRVCVACGTRFYDLTKSPAVCPEMRHRTAGRSTASAPHRRQRGRGQASEEAVTPAPEDVDVEVEGVEDVEEEDVLEAADDLEDDADVISGDIEVESDTDEHER